MKINPYLSFDKNCAEALDVYAACFGGKIEMKMLYGDSPMASEMPAEAHGLIMHARMSIQGSVLMASDAACGRYEAPKGTWISVNIDEPAEAERIFATLAEGGNVAMPIGETFWAQRFGMVVDRFGIPWMINCEKAA